MTVDMFFCCINIIDLDLSRTLNNRRWNTTYGNVENDIRILFDWLNKHIEPLNNNIQLIQKTYSHINTINNYDEYENIYFNIKGMRVRTPRMGSIVILTDNKEHKTYKVLLNR